ncbi:hypothetical protein [Metarhizobium album]|uniref:hypothetical protein n=1 Tax=Metarhizobium album TaxID=2182425 RepID=UPI003075CE56
MHVVTPLTVPKGKKPSWDEAKGFAHDVCESEARDNPDLYLIKMAGGHQAACKISKGRGVT